MLHERGRLLHDAVDFCRFVRIVSKSLTIAIWQAACGGRLHT
jgi:hypothetical protein